MNEPVPCMTWPTDPSSLPFTPTDPSSGTPKVTLVSTTTGSSSLPFTGADVEELAVVGLGAVAAGGLLLRRRRKTA
jgi:LPXTG-motif cell wall-anchored protein